MLHASNLSNSFWANVVATYYIQNWLVLKVIEVSKTPLTLWCGKTPNLNHLCIFGFLAYVHILDEQHIKNRHENT